MKKIIQTGLGLMLCASAAWAQPPLPAAMDRPSLQSPKAKNLAMLMLAHAGARLVAVGERGAILYSDDDGQSWQQAATPSSVSLVALRFVDAQRGWAVGHMGVVLHTDDGGKTWVKQLDGLRAAQLTLEAAQKSGDEKAVSQAEYLVNDGPDKPFFDLQFNADGSGFIVGAYNLAFRTEDGGRTWRSWSSHLDNPKGLHLYGITRVGNTLYVVGEQGLLLRSDDNGQHFSPQPSPYKGTWFGIAATRKGDLLLYGLRGTAYVSRDQGRHWIQAATNTGASISAALELSDGRLLLAAQSGQLLASKDQGMNFAPLAFKSPLPVAGLLQAADGRLLLATLHGVQQAPSGDAH